MKRVIATICAAWLLPSAIAFAATPAKSNSLPRAQALEPQLQQSEIALLQQRMAVIASQHAQNEQLKVRVTELEKQTAANRGRQAQRDDKIADLQRQLEALREGKGGELARPVKSTARAGPGH